MDAKKILELALCDECGETGFVDKQKDGIMHKNLKGKWSCYSCNGKCYKHYDLFMPLLINELTTEINNLT